MEESSHSTQSSKQNPPFQEDLRSGTGNPDIDHAVSFWKQFDLTTARAQWDKICNDMREMKTASISGRKRLNDLTKSFRAKSREEQTSQVQDLVKAYQEEIDQLSRRSKLSEVSFFDLHKSLYDAPDPGFFLEQLLHTSLHSNSHVLEIEKLKAELAQYDDEFQRLKNQEVTIRRLEDQLTDFQQRNEVKVEEEVERRVDLIRQQCQEEVLEAKEMQKATERRLSVALEAVKQAQSQSERCQAQLLEVSEKYENKLSAMMSENSLLAENIQRLQLRCSEMESENDHLKKGAVIATSSATSSPHPKSDSADLAFTADRQTSLELLVAQLRGQVQEKEEQVRQERLVADAALREAQLLYAKEKEQLARARQELLSRPSPRDVTALRRRLRLVEKIAFHGARADRGEGRGEDDVEEEMEEHDGDGDDVAPENHSVPLENLLTAKILGLERDVTALRRQNLDLTETQSSQTDVIASLKQTLEHRQQALARAERELEARNALLERMMKEQSAKKENALTSLEDLLADVTSPPPLSANNQAASHSLPSREGGGGDDVAEASSQMIAILTNQRDRYKERLTQAEALLLKSEETSEALRAAKTQLEEENVQLYSKIKYLQNANTTSASTSTSSSSVGRNNNHNNKRAFDGRASSEESRLNHDRQSNLSDTFYFRQHSDDVESKYDSLYEQRMNPFAEFSLHEKQRKLRELSVADRIVLNTTLAIIQSNAGRNFVLIYFGAMHLLVFFTIYYTAHNVHHGCDPSLDHISLQ